MSRDVDGSGSTGETLDVGEYCRRVEQHLTRVNAGHLVRIVGPGFELVRTWAREGIPLSIVLHGISQKAERHHVGSRATRPLRLEFCESDVRAVFDQWRRAVGLPASSHLSPSSAAMAEDGGAIEPADDHRRVSLSKHLERAGDRLSRAAGRVDLPDRFRDVLSHLLEEVVSLREQAKRVRGAGRDDLTARLPGLDAQLTAAAREAVTPDDLAAIEAEATGDLAPFRLRLADDVWRHSLDVTVDRLLRERLGLPTLELP